ncbi:MAG: ABC transporter ATP-binding protein [Gammaproteobacteria bacterium]|nr:ABC transporter ATP-binding protein [Gammaproteobacteria bacterium]MCH9744634.1 ABC transporter ATP-binding protein [Gammaproteobacteria bacterium]
MDALVVKDLVKTYKNGVQALRNISFSVEKGDFFGLLGPNGAGKSTIIGILTSLVLKSSGYVSVMDFDIDHEFAKAKACLGVTPQEFNFNGFKKPMNILIDQAGYYGIPAKEAAIRAEKYLKKLDLWEKRFDIARNLSGGMKRRLMIARAMIHEPQILILDEPTAGVDIEIRRSMWSYLQELNAQGVTIILTTHYLEEAENLCRNLAIIDKGQLIEYTSTQHLLHQLEKERFILYTQAPYGELPEIDAYQLFPVDQCSIEVEVTKGQGLYLLFEKLQQQGIQVNSMRNKSNRLEELFLKLTQKELSSDTQ